MYKKTLLLPLLIYPSTLWAFPFTEANENSVEINQRYNIQTGVRSSDEIINNMIPVGSSGRGYTIYQDNNNRYKGQPSYCFYMQDDQKIRVELSALFVTEQDIKTLSDDELVQQINAKSLYHYSKGKATRDGDTWGYNYGLYIPKETNAKSQGIISQWHGIPDRTTIRTPAGKTVRYSLNEFNDHILSRMYFKKNIGHDNRTNKPNGYYVDQGGYPPVTLKIGQGFLYVTVRSDNKRVTDKTDRVNIRPPTLGPKLSPKQSKTIAVPYAQALPTLPKDQWIDLKWEIIWSQFSHSADASDSYTATPGLVKLTLNGKQVLNWQGIVGSNDQYAPYFKYGIYKAGKAGLTIQLAGFEQYRK